MYYKISNYTVKCRLYPNKSQMKKMNDSIHAVHVYHNAVVYDMFVNLLNTNEKLDKDSGKTIHFPDLSKATKKNYKNKIAEMNPCISNAPAGALTTNYGVILCDLKKQLESQVSGENVNKGKAIRPVENSKPQYYSKSHPRRSYTYAESFGKISFSENKNVFYIDLAKVGKVKVRGFNMNLRFDPSCCIDFKEYVSHNKNQKMKVTISKDNCGEYNISILFKEVYKLVKNIPEKKQEKGVDVGVVDIAILSDGTKYKNKKIKDGMNGENKRKRKVLHRRLNRAWGYSNEIFREERKKDSTLKPSKGYWKAKQKLAKFERDIKRKRRLENDYITLDIVRKSSFIGIESLSVTEMIKNAKGNTNKKRARIRDSLLDAAMGEILALIKMKCNWYDVECVSIGKYEASTQICSECGFKIGKLSTDIREWDCPKCGFHHDRDINAAKVILKIALQIREEQKLKKCS